MASTLSRFLKDDSATSAIDYALIAGFVVVLIIGMLQVTGGTLNTKFGQIATKLN